MAAGIHERSVVIDGLQICDWSREIFEEQHEAGLTAVNCTCSVWEGFAATMENVAAFRRRIEDNADILRPIASMSDIAAAKREGRVGIILGFQNTWAIEDRLERLELFHGLGVRIIQMTYNTQNLVGAGCLGVARRRPCLTTAEMSSPRSTGSESSPTSRTWARKPPPRSSRAPRSRSCIPTCARTS